MLSPHSKGTAVGPDVQRSRQVKDAPPCDIILAVGVERCIGSADKSVCTPFNANVTVAGTMEAGTSAAGTAKLPEVII